MPKVVRRRPRSVFGPKVFFSFFDLAGNRFPLLGRRTYQRFQLRSFFAQGLVLGADFHFLELAQIAQTHVEDRLGLDLAQLEGLHQDGLWLVLFADDFDHLVEVEIGDQVSTKHFQAMFNFGQPMFGPAEQHFPSVVEPFAQRFRKPEHLRDAAFHEHVHIERRCGPQAR